MTDIIISHDRTIDNIVLNNKYPFSAYITIGLTEKTDFYIKLEFSNLSIDEFKIIANLSQLSKEIAISSELIKKENYNISHLVVMKHIANSELAITWECISDSPDYKLDLE